jgi:3-oxoacyl-[acyl-carrier-protein] synthase-3
MNAVRVVSTGSYLPGDPIDNEQLARLVGPLPGEVLEGIQVQQRHWMIDPETGRHRECNSDMAAKAARTALARAGLDPSDVDLLIVSTSSPEYPLPPMATFVQEKLGLRACTAIEIRSGCAGAVEAFEVASMYLESGRHTTAVVIGSEAISPIIAPLYVGVGPDRMRMRDRLGAYNFGDGAGAIVLQAEAGGRSALAGSAAACVGGHLPPGMQIIGGGTDAPASDQQRRKRLVELRVDVTAAARLTPSVISEGLTDLFRRSEVRPGEIDHFVVPEGNAGYLRDEIGHAGGMAAEWGQLEAKLCENLARVGATGSAAVPLALDDAWVSGRLGVGDVVLLLAIETSKWKYAGAIFRWTAASPARARSGARS